MAKQHFIGSFEVTIRVKLDQDVTEEEARKFVEEMDYTLTAPTGAVSIQDTEVVSDDITQRIEMAELNEDEKSLYE